MSDTAIFISRQSAEIYAEKVIKDISVDCTEAGVYRHIKRGQLLGYVVSMKFGEKSVLMNEELLAKYANRRLPAAS